MFAIVVALLVLLAVVVPVGAIAIGMWTADRQADAEWAQIRRDIESERSRSPFISSGHNGKTA